MRDRNDNALVVCSIENIDPMGVHTGDSVTVAPQQTLTDARLPGAARPGARGDPRRRSRDGRLQHPVRGEPADGEVVVIEMNPRVSRSSALASKATGFPIAKIAARLAVGYALEEIPNDITRRTPASFEPTIDYAVVKIPRFAFEKFPLAEGGLTTQMKSVGEAMAIGRTFKQAFMKAMRSRELDAKLRRARGRRRSCSPASSCPSHDRYELLLEALRRGHSRRRSCTSARRSTPGSWASSRSWSRPRATAGKARSRARRSSASRTTRPASRARSASRPACARPTSRSTPARPSSRPRRPTSTPRTSARSRAATRATPSCAAAREPSVVILGSGPNRIGQGIEFDYCCVHAAMTVRETGPRRGDGQLQPRDGLDRLRHLDTPLLRAADRRGRARGRRRRAARGRDRAVRRPDAAADRGRPARRPGVPLLGTPVDSIDLAEDRGRFGGLLAELGHPGAAVRRSRTTPARRSPRRARSASRCWCAPRTCSAAARWSSATPRRTSSLPGAARGRGRASACTRCCSTASSRTRSSSTSTRLPTARTSTSRGSCSTSRRPACTPATRPACCRRSASARTCWRRCAARRARSRSASASSGS